MRVSASVCTAYERAQRRESKGETRQAAATSAVVFWGELIPAAGCVADVQMQQFDPSLQLEFRMLNHARPHHNIHNKVDEG